MSLSESQLKFAEWWILHKYTFKKILFIALIALDLIMVGYASWGAWDYFYLGVFQYDQILNELARHNINYQDYWAGHKPKDLIILPVSMVKDNDGYDLWSLIQNPNSRWFVQFEYQFILGTRQTPLQKGFVLPQGEKYLAAFDVPFFSAPQVKINIKNVSWQNIKLFKVQDFDQFKKTHFNFEIKDIKVIPLTSGESSLSKVVFVVLNQSAYNFWEVAFWIFLKDNNSIKKVNYLVLERLKSGESRSVSLVWQGIFSPSSIIEIIPEVNILEDSVYMKPY